MGSTSAVDLRWQRRTPYLPAAAALSCIQGDEMNNLTPCYSLQVHLFKEEQEWSLSAAYSAIQEPCQVHLSAMCLLAAVHDVWCLVK